MITRSSGVKEEQIAILDLNNVGNGTDPQFPQHFSTSPSDCRISYGFNSDFLRKNGKSVMEFFSKTEKVPFTIEPHKRTGSFASFLLNKGTCANCSAKALFEKRLDDE